MKVEYRQYQYGGGYVVKHMSLPEGSHIYEVPIWRYGCKVKEKEDLYTPGYVIKSPQEFDDSMKIGDAWYRFYNGIYFDSDSVLVEPIEDCTPPKDCYIVFEQSNMNARQKPMAFQMTDKGGNLIELDRDAIRRYDKEIAGIGKIRKFTRKGIETCLVSIKNMSSEDLTEVCLHTFSYGYTWGEGYSTHPGNFFTTESKYKQLYSDKLEEYYKLFKE